MKAHFYQALIGHSPDHREILLCQRVEQERLSQGWKGKGRRSKRQGIFGLINRTFLVMAHLDFLHEMWIKYHCPAKDGHLISNSQIQLLMVLR